MAVRSQLQVDRTEAVSHNGMVAAKTPQAADAGADVLRKGYAIDSAVTCASPHGWSNPG